MRATRKVLGIIGSVTFALPTRAAADNARSAMVSLDWKRTEDSATCIEAAALERSVEALLGRKVFGQRTESDFHIEGSVARSSDSVGFTATLTITAADGKSGVRELRTTSANCAVLEGPLPLVLAMMVAEREVITIRSPDLPPPAPPAPSPSAPSAPAPLPKPQPEAASWHFESSAGAVFSFGMFPSLGVASRADLLGSPPRLLPIAVHMTFWPASKYMTESAGVVLSAWQAGLSMCPRLFAGGKWSTMACLGMNAGVITGIGVGLPVTHEQARASVDAELLGVLTVRIIDSLAVDLAVGGALPFLRTNFSYTAHDGTERALYEPWPLTPMVATALRLGRSD